MTLYMNILKLCYTLYISLSDLNKVNKIGRNALTKYPVPVHFPRIMRQPQHLHQIWRHYRRQQHFHHRCRLPCLQLRRLWRSQQPCRLWHQLAEAVCLPTTAGTHCPTVWMGYVHVWRDTSTTTVCSSVFSFLVRFSFHIYFCQLMLVYLTCTCFLLPLLHVIMITVDNVPLKSC